MRFLAFLLPWLAVVTAVDDDLYVQFDDGYTDHYLTYNDTDVNATDVNVTMAPTETPTCLQDPPSFKIVGTQAVQTLAQLWKEVYLQNETRNECDALQIEIEGYSWAVGAARVCGNHPIHSDADLAGMSGPFYHPQADTENGWKYNCKFGSKRKTTLIKLGYEGVAMVVGEGSVAAQCIGRLGGSLTRSQLRWIFSTFTLQELWESGADKKAVQYPDDDESTRLWSELHPGCEPIEIGIGWVANETEARDFLESRVMKPGEYLDSTRAKYYEFKDLQSATDHIKEDGSIITFLRIGDLATSVFTEQEDYLDVVDIQDKRGRPHTPDAWEFSTNAYPLSRPIFLGVWDNPDSLELTAPFIDFALGEQGTRLLKEAGYWAIMESEELIMRTRLQLPGGMPKEDIVEYCGRKYASVSMAGSSIVSPVARLWSELYKIGCPTAQFDISEGGSSSGAERVCGVGTFGKPPVDIGNMARKWAEDEARPKNGSPHIYDCQLVEKGEEPRSVVRLDIGKDGLTIIVKKGGIADQCQEILGGLTIDQLRWIYSSYSEEQLASTGWDPASVPNSDGNPNTHLWSELDPRCANEEIYIMGGFLGEGTHTDFQFLVMKDMDNGEDIDLQRPQGYVQGYGHDLLTQLQGHRDSIAFVGFTYYNSNQEKLSAVPIKNRKGNFVAPSIESIGDGTYHYLVRTISMNLWDDPAALRDAIPFLRFGFDYPDLLRTAGMVPLQGQDLEAMKDRLMEVADYEGGDDFYFDEVSSGLTHRHPQVILTVLAGATTVMFASLWFGIIS